MPPTIVDSAISSYQQTTVEVQQGKIAITLAEASTMQHALIEALRVSSLEDRDYLLRMTEQAPAWIDAEGTLRIGAWLLQARGGELVLVFRMPVGTPAVRAFVAELVKAPEGWQVRSLREERISPRR